MKKTVYLIFISILFLGCQNIAKKSNSKSVTKNNFKNKNYTVDSKKESMQKKYVKDFQNELIVDKKIYQELSGQAVPSKWSASKILQLARSAKAVQNYPLALQRYNLLNKKYPNSNEMRQAYLDKAEIYKLLGLNESADFNIKQSKKLTGFQNRNVSSNQLKK